MRAIGDYLYAVTVNHETGFEVWRTKDGDNWEVVVSGGLGDPHNTSGRGLMAFKGFLYVGVENRKAGAQIIRRAIKDNGDFVQGTEWETVVAEHTHALFGIGNYWFSSMTEYHGTYVMFLMIFLIFENAKIQVISIPAR